MSSIVKIKENYINYSAREKRIADYVLENLSDVINQSTQTVSYETRTSPATVVRFAKKIGFDGFSSLKMEIAKEYQTYQSQSISETIEPSDSIEKMVQKAEYTNRMTFDKTYRLLDYNVLDSVTDALINARKIFLFGVGGAGIACEDLYHKLIRINKDVEFVQDFHMLLTSLAHIGPNDVTIAMSYSGTTREIVRAQQFAKEQGALTVVLTANRKSDVIKFSDYIISIPQEETTLKLGSISSRFSFLIISDLLYFGIAKNTLDETNKALMRTRYLFEHFREE